MKLKLFTDNFFRQLVSRAVREDYLDNVTGFAWLIIQPLMLLAVYTFVFTVIFKARVPEAGQIGFASYLAVAFWPWIAFSESVVRASTSVSSNAALIGKVAFPTEMIPLSTVTASFLMNLVGYAAVLLVLQLTGTPIHWLGALLALPLLFLLYLFASGLALLLSALQVFLRDVKQILPPLMTFWFFGTPILYSSSILPPSFAPLMEANPMAWYVEKLRAMLLFGEYTLGLRDLLAPALTVLVLFIGVRFFRRLSPHFEDFL
jgi:ABC-type polysaccharide/polyol phosphate export permease